MQRFLFIFLVIAFPLAVFAVIDAFRHEKRRAVEDVPTTFWQRVPWLWVAGSATILLMTGLFYIAYTGDVL